MRLRPPKYGPGERRGNWGIIEGVRQKKGFNLGGPWRKHPHYLDRWEAGDYRNSDDKEHE